MKFFSTRNKDNIVSFNEAVLEGMASDGGLFVPSYFPKVNIDNLLKLNYKDLAYEILSLYLDDFKESKLRDIISKAYDKKFPENPAFLKKTSDCYYLELYHGRTLAFKDFALSILPLFMENAIKESNLKEKILILTATSGDTGSSALSWFSNVYNTDIVVFFPQNGVSEIQRLQMTTQEGNNTGVFGINGNFDDAQSNVKKIFKDKEIIAKIKEMGYKFSSANSINIGRLLPQIVYYFHAYNQLVNMGEISIGDKVSFAVPTGNFGDILAGYYAKNMGLPIEKLIIASNENNILTDFFETGIYDANRDLKITNSPSMDIIISSNLERLIYHKTNDTQFVGNIERNLEENRFFKLNEDFSEFYANFSNEDETLDEIKRVFEKDRYLIDTHTAVGKSVARKYRNDKKAFEKIIVLSTASAYKFSNSVIKALGLEDHGDLFSNCKIIKDFTKTQIPKEILNLKDKKIIHDRNIEVSQMKDCVLKYLGEKNEN